MELWQHENERVYRDRLINHDDELRFLKILTDTMRDEIGIEPEEHTRTIFTSIGSSRKLYQKVLKSDAFVKQVKTQLERYNALSRPKERMELVMFEEACVNVAKISRILKHPKGNVLLMGVGGSGRQSLARLSAHCCGLQLFTIEVRKGYNFVKWREDVKRMLLSVILKNQQTCMLLNDGQFVDERMLEDISSLLNSGVIFGLPLTPEEEQDLFDFSRTQCLRKSQIPNKVNILNAQVSRVRRNLHICLALSPLDALLQARLRCFPSLINCCSTIWMGEWPEEALLGVAQQGLDIQEPRYFECLKFMHKYVEGLSREYHQKLGRYNYVTPMSYLELISLYNQVRRKKRGELDSVLQRFTNGISKLKSANEEVVLLKQHLKKEEPRLIKIQADVKELLVKLKLDNAEETKTRKAVALEEAEASKQQIQANLLKAQVDDDMRAANEELARTLEKLKFLKPSNIVEIRVMPQPPRKIKLVVMTLCYLFLDDSHVKGLFKKNYSEDDFWNFGKQHLLSDPNGLFKMLMLPETKDKIKRSRVRRLKELIKQYEEFWTEEQMKGASLAILYIYMWVDCVIKYKDKKEETKPLLKK